MMQKVRVLHVFGRMNRGGAETLIMNIFRNIDREKFQFDFLVHSEKEGHYDQEIKELGGNIYSVPHPRKNILQYKKELKKILRENGPYDVFHSHVFSFSGYVLQIAKEEGVPKRIAHSHNTQDGHSSGVLRNIYRNYMRKLILKNATHLLGCSKEACFSLFGPDCFLDSRLIILKNAIDLSFFEPSEGIYVDLRSELGLNKNTKLIGNVGSFTEQKNHKKLLEIFKQVSIEVANVHLILVGDGPLKEKIKQLVKEYEIDNNVHFLGIRNDVPQLMRNFDLFLFPSLFEGLGIVLIEAQAAGTMCVVADTVPKEADLKLGLIKYLKLEDDLDIWVRTIKKCMSKKATDWELIRRRINYNGYNIKDQIKRISELYA